MKDILLAVTERLKSLNYEVTEGDLFALNFLIKKVTNHILNYCNISEVPSELEEASVDMVVGEFLKEKKAVDPDGLIAFDLEGAISQIKEGDTTVQFSFGAGDMTPEQRLDALITFLLKRGEEDLGAFRCVKW